MREAIIVVPYEEEWPYLFQEMGRRLRNTLGELAVRIDHIGSTSVPGLAAKPVIDIQISVFSFEPMDQLVERMREAGFLYREDNPDLSKRYFRELPGHLRTHVHVRRVGSWSEQISLLFRDYLRAHPEACMEYAALKYRLAEDHRENRNQYADAKSPFIWRVLQEAHEWSQVTGWSAGATDL
ncbi:MAG: hypothetical protein K0R47_1335 [Brevibacillus sp.]|nr:hypothetical protein [Brevibacillus sp.]